jgi:hypothetical protein
VPSSEVPDPPPTLLEPPKSVWVPRPAEIAWSVADALAWRNFASVVGRCDPNLREKLSVERLRTLWLEATSGAGELRSLRPDRPRNVNGWPVNEVVAEFDRGEVEITVSVRPETGEVAGLWLWRWTSGGEPKPSILPDGWLVSGDGAADYRVTLDPAIKHGGRRSAMLSALAPHPARYVTLMQGFDAAAFRNKRIRVSAFLRGEGLTGRADAWARVRGLGSAEGGALGGASCPLDGTFDWKPCELVFDVPDESVEVQLGFGITGDGALWIDDVKIEVVSRKTAVTTPRRLAAPTNLDFETAPADGPTRP